MTTPTIAMRAEIAEKVMGWKRHSRNAWCYVLPEHADGIIPADGVKCLLDDWQPDLDRAQAMAVLEKCAKVAPEMMMCFNGMFSFHGAPTGSVRPVYGPQAPTLPLAVCLFAAKVFGVKWEDAE